MAPGEAGDEAVRAGTGRGAEHGEQQYGHGGSVPRARRRHGDLAARRRNLWITGPGVDNRLPGRIEPDLRT
ncbi:hypothetical protein RAJCM14343_3456 [Rhodococcus aetherivorans]|uniref:Uncharacterized protein n=1 Tax=Rhodococcus aetherivorans TaxID=191292 RepID=A0ABQ0YNR5_9NOCA|nr:hypothetical protein A4U64_11820 [Rhodococcus sp. WB1]GES38196.1 hypothetical protein RAJCM14343_3456 [Rhodococcus aetherivorans]